MPRRGNSPGVGRAARRLLPGQAIWCRASEAAARCGSGRLPLRGPALRGTRADHRPRSRPVRQGHQRLYLRREAPPRRRGPDPQRAATSQARRQIACPGRRRRPLAPLPPRGRTAISNGVVRSACPANRTAVTIHTGLASPPAPRHCRRPPEERRGRLPGSPRGEATQELAILASGAGRSQRAAGDSPLRAF